MSKKANKLSGPANGRTDIAEGNGNGREQEVSFGADEIAARAYELYEREGHQDGRDMDHWYKAEQELHAERQSDRPSAPQSGSQASQPTQSRSARQMPDRLPDTLAGASAAG